jgi:hypothetical protein
MKFTLVYNGPLPASGNKSKIDDVTRIREKLSPQLEHLWSTHHALQVLKEYGWAEDPNAQTKVGFISTPDGPPTPRQKSQMLPGSMINLCDWISVGAKTYKPLIRKTLNLNCDLSILFLRQEDPGALITQGGDLDGRLKTLFDALRLPTKHEQDVSPLT